MVRADVIKNELFGEVGFRQSPITEYAIVDSDNQLSNSGLYFQDSTGLITIQNIKESQQAIDISDVDFNAYLKTLQESVIVESARKVINGQNDFISSINLFPYTKTFENVIDNESEFVGLSFESYDSSKIGKANWVELCFNEDVTFDLYLYNSNLPGDPIETLTVNAEANKSVIVSVDWLLSDNSSHKGGSYYLGYFQDDLGTAKAIKKDYELSSYQNSIDCFYVQPMSVDHTGTTIDVSSIKYESVSFGLNCGISVYDDFTELIVLNKNLFAELIQLQMGEKVLNLIKSSIRRNSTTRLSAINVSDIDFELYGNESFKISGISTKLGMAVKNLKDMFFCKSIIKRRTLS